MELKGLPRKQEWKAFGQIQDLQLQLLAKVNLNRDSNLKGLKKGDVDIAFK